MIDGPEDLGEKIKMGVHAYQLTDKHGSDTLPGRSLKCIELALEETVYFGYRGDKPSWYLQEYHSSLYMLHCWLCMYRIWLKQKVQEEKLLKPENDEISLESKIKMLQILQDETRNSFILMLRAIDHLPLD